MDICIKNNIQNIVNEKCSEIIKKYISIKQKTFVKELEKNENALFMYSNSEGKNLDNGVVISDKNIYYKNILFDQNKLAINEIKSLALNDEHIYINNREDMNINISSIPSNQRENFVLMIIEILKSILNR